MRVLKLLFATDRLHVPDDRSGSVQSTHSLCQALVTRGHRCEVVASLPRRPRHYFATAVHRLSRRRMVLEWSDRANGYPVHRGSEWRFPERATRWIRRLEPDVVILDSPRQLELLRTAGNVPTRPVLLFLHDPSFPDHATGLRDFHTVSLVANSPYTASVARERLGINPPIVPPIVRFDRYRTEREAADAATLVSPTRAKGVDLVLELASRLPDVPFLLVEGWPMGREDWARLRDRTANLPNVELRRSTADMREVYRRTRFLLMPGREHVETFGRVAVEAQVSGIPVLAFRVGALPWVVGEGGILLEPDAGADDWSAALRSLAEDAGRYAELSRRARANVARSDFDPSHLVERFEQIILATS